MKICPKCMSQIPDSESYCPKCAVDLQQAPSMPNFDNVGLGMGASQLSGMQMSFPQAWSQSLAVPLMPRPMPPVSPVQMVADLVTRVHLQTGIKSIAIFCPHCKAFDDFHIMPLKRGENVLVCKNDPDRMYRVSIGWFEEVSVFPIK